MAKKEIDLNLPKKRKVQLPASFIKRSLAFFIDLLIIQFIIISPFKKILGRIIPVGSIRESYSIFSTSQASTSSVYAIGFFITAMIFIYFTFTEYITGQSIGKKIIGLYVVSDKEKLRLSQVLLRNMILLPIFPFIILWIVDPIFMMFSKSQRRLSDMAAHTNIIQLMTYP